jgi:hypothetical protein
MAKGATAPKKSRWRLGEKKKPNLMRQVQLNNL